MAQTDPSRTERATGKRRNKARNKGNVPKSQEMPKATVLLGGLVGLTVYVHVIGSQMADLYTWFLGHSAEIGVGPEAVYALFVMIAKSLAVMLLPLMLFLGLVSYVTMRLQVGPLWSTQILFQFNLAKHFNIMAGIKRLFISPKTLIRMGRSLLQAIVIGIAPYIVIKKEFANLLPLFYQNAHGLAGYLLVTGAKLVTYALVPMILIAVADLIYTRWDYEEQLKMTKDEVKDERKQAEGDPVVKTKQRQEMFKIMALRMMEKVPKADVIITNPTHLAVALRYDATEAPAPVVLAKGRDYLAEKIKEIAREHHIPIRENKPLAQALYKSVEVGEMIPEELYQAVAAILAQLYTQRSRRT